jgi:hypothetical protein
MSDGLFKLWGSIATIAGIVAGVVVFWQNVLNTRKLKLEIIELQKKQEKETHYIQQASLDEIRKYSNSLRLNRGMSMLLVVMFISAASLS